MNINAKNNVSPIFGVKINLPAQNKKALFGSTLEEKLYEINPSSKKSIISKIEDYADRLGTKQVDLILREGVNSTKINEHGDLLIIKSGEKMSTMRFDNNTTESELSATILGNMQDNYRLENPYVPPTLASIKARKEFSLKA